MVDINEWVKVTVLNFKENSYHDYSTSKFLFETRGAFKTLSYIILSGKNS